MFGVLDDSVEIEKGYAKLPEKNGLGAEPDYEKLKNYRIA